MSRTKNEGRLSPLLQTEWRDPAQSYKMSSRATVGMDDGMSEIMRRLAAAGGIH